MKYLYTLFSSFFLFLALYAQDTIPTPPASFEIVVAFGSKGTGISSDEFLKLYTKKFNKRNKVKLNVYLLSGCGREGETKVLFSLKKIKPTQRKKLLAELKTVVDKENLKNNNISASNGDINIDYNQPISNYSYCRGKIKKWGN